MRITMAALGLLRLLAMAGHPRAPLANAIIGFKCQMAKAAITRGSETMCEAGWVSVNRS